MISLNTTVLSARAGRVTNKTARSRIVSKRNKRRDINGTCTCSRFPGKLQAGSEREGGTPRQSKAPKFEDGPRLSAWLGRRAAPSAPRSAAPQGGLGDS